MPEPTDDEGMNKTLRFIVAVICGTVVLCGWGVVLWSLRH